MELAAGWTLRDVQRERGPRTLRRAIERHGQILSALSAAHRRGIVHCDLKPANLMFRRDAELPGVEVMLGDFGVAHLPNASGQATSAHPEAVGTLAYMAPEQRRGEVTPAADVYASAVVLYEMFTGHTPWPREAAIGGVRRADDFRVPADVLAGLTEAAPAAMIRSFKRCASASACAVVGRFVGSGSASRSRWPWTTSLSDGASWKIARGSWKSCARRVPAINTSRAHGVRPVNIS